MGKVVVQKLKKTVGEKIDRALLYYSIISALNSLHLTQKQLELLAFTAIRGTITPMAARVEFAEMFNSSVNSVENLKGQLVKIGLIVKKGGMYKVNPTIELDFSNDVVVQINLEGNEASD